MRDGAKDPAATKMAMEEPAQVERAQYRHGILRSPPACHTFPALDDVFIERDPKKKNQAIKQPQHRREEGMKNGSTQQTKTFFAIVIPCNYDAALYHVR